MALLKYLQRTSTLPKPQGPLSRVMPSLSVAAANEEVKRVLDEEGKNLTIQQSRLNDQGSLWQGSIWPRAAAPNFLVDMVASHAGVNTVWLNPSAIFVIRSNIKWFHVTTCRPRPIRESFLREIGNLPETWKFCPTKVSCYMVC